MANVNNINIEGAMIIWKNFSGERDKFNPGKRGFSVVIDDTVMADELRQEGWNVKDRPLQEGADDSEQEWTLPVKLNMNRYTQVWLIVGNHKTLLDEDTVSQLDVVDIVNCDISIRPYEWEMNGRTGITAYVDSMYVTIRENKFAEKYADALAADPRITCVLNANLVDLPLVHLTSQQRLQPRQGQRLRCLILVIK